MVCAYETAKYVHINDARLGILKTTFLVAIVVYVGVFEMWGRGGYLESSPIVGVVRFSLQQPTLNNCYPSEPGCVNAFSPLNTLPYCAQAFDGDARDAGKNESSPYAGSVYRCEIYEAINAQLVSESSLTVITRASTTNQTLVCDAEALTCPRTYNDTSPEYKFYIAESEAFTILFDHAVTASKICSANSGGGSYACSAESSVFQGRLLSKSEELCEHEHAKGNAFEDYRGTKEIDRAPCYIEPNRTASNQDFFSLDVLLMAAGIRLDDCNKANPGSPCQTYRDSGATLLLNIYWTDFSAYNGMVDPSYYYSPQLIAGSSFKQYVSFYSNYREQRTLLNAHGVKVAVLLGGEFSSFNVVTFLVTLTTTLGLLAVATTIVDLLMLHVLPEKKRYQEAKYENTEEFEAGRVVSSAFAGLNQLVHRDEHEDGSGQVGDVDIQNGANDANAGENEGLNEPLL